MRVTYKCHSHKSHIQITLPTTRTLDLLSLPLCLRKILCNVAPQTDTQMSPLSDKGIQSAHSVIPHLRTINKAIRLHDDRTISWHDAIPFSGHDAMLILNTQIIHNVSSYFIRLNYIFLCVQLGGGHLSHFDTSHKTRKNVFHQNLPPEQENDATCLQLKIYDGKI